MTRTLKVLIGAAALAIIGVSTASAQTGPLLGRELYLFDGGSGSTQNTVRLIAPPADTLTASWDFTLPKNSGGTDFILVNKDGLGKTAWEDGLTIFWGIEGNCDPITPWNPNTLTGNYIGHCLNDIDFRSGNDHMNFWFNDQLTPRLVLDSNGRMLLNVVDGSEGLVIGGNGPNGPDAGIVLDCAFPPTVGMEVNALATGILMPTCATAPLVGISIKAQTTGLEIDSSGNTGILISESLTGINVTGTTHSINATGTVRLNTVAADASATQVLARNGSNDVVYRSIAATGTIVTTPSGGTVNYLPLWSPSTTELGTSLISQDFPATTATVNGNLTITGTTVDITNVPTTTGFDNILIRNATGDLEVSNAQFVSLPDGTTPSNGQILIGNGTTFVLNTINADNGITVTNGPGTIELDVDNPVPAGTTNNSTLRWNTGTSTWQENVNLLSDASGNTRNNGTLTLSVANTVLDASDTRILTQDAATGLVGHRTVAATGDIVTAPIAGTTGRITRWTASNQIGDGSLDDNGTGTLSRSGNIDINPGAANTLATNGAFTAAGNVTLGDAPADVITLTGSTVDISNVPTSTGTTNLLRRNASGDIEVSTLTFATIPGGTLAANRNVRTDGAGGLTVGAINLAGGANEVSGILPVGNGGTGVDGSAAANGTLLIGNGTGYTLATLTQGAGMTITNGAGSISLAVTNPAPTGTTTNSTLRWSGSAWVENVNLLSDASGNTDVNGTLTVDGNTTLGDADADVHAIRGATSINTAGNAATSIGHIASTGNVNVLTGSGTITLNSQAANVSIAAGTTFSLQSATGGSINTLIPTSTTIGTNNIASSLALNSPSITAVNIPNTGDNTDYFVVWETTGPTGQLKTASVATMIGGTPWILGGNTVGVTGANNILGINYASGQTLQLYVQGFQAAEFAITGALTQNFDFTARENVTLGDADDDNHAIRGDLDVNTTNASALNVNINTSAFANVTTIGSSTALNTTSINSPVVNAPNLPTGAAGNAMITTDGTQLFETTPTQLFGGLPWVRGGNAGALSGVLGTTDAVDVALTAGNVSHIDLVAATQATSINTLASSGTVTLGYDDAALGGVTKTIDLQSEIITAKNLGDVGTYPVAPANVYSLVYDNSTGQIVKKFVGSPVQSVKSAKAIITGAPPSRVFTISDTFVAANSTITVTLQDGSDVNDYTVTLPAGSITAGVGFTVRLSGVMGAGSTKTVHYTITNP